MVVERKKVTFIVTAFLLVISLLAFIIRADRQRDVQITSTNREANSVQVLTEEESATETAALLDYIVITEAPVPTPTKTPTPTSTITPTPIKISSSELNELFTKYSREYSVSEDLLKKIAYCESKLNPQASNGTYGGLFQFSVGAWTTARRAMNMDQNPQLRFNPEESIRTAAFKIATGGVGIWPNCSR